MTPASGLDCGRARAWLAADIDHELDALQSVALAEHLADCAECRAHRDVLLALQAAVRRQAPYHRAPDSLRAHARAAAAPGLPAPRSIAPHRPRLRAFARWALPLAAGIAIGTVLDLGRTLPVPGGAMQVALADEVAHAHLRSLEPGHLADVASSDRHTVKPWFAGRIDYAPSVTDFADQGFPLVGGRLDYLADRTVAALVYQRREHVINAFTWPGDPGVPDTEAVPGTYRGYQMVHWSQGGTNWWLVSDLNAAELRDFARLLGAEGAPHA